MRGLLFFISLPDKAKMTGMKKIYLYITAALIVATAAVSVAAAQNRGGQVGGDRGGRGSYGGEKRFEIGVRAGIFQQDEELTGGDFVNPVTGSTDKFATESRMGFNVAIAARLRLTALGRGALGLGLFLQPEIVFSQNNYRIQQIWDDGTRGELSRIRFQSVEVPVMLSFKISILRIQAGPVFCAMYKNDTRSGGINFIPRRPLVGYGVGASVDIVAGLVLDGRYNGQFKKLQNNIRSGETVYQSVRGSLTSWSVGLSYMF